MDDSCAVCAEPLEWAAYGACGHRDVCSTCVVRLRFICNDRRCCICKTESNFIFVTKALGDYTRMINDFSILPSEPREGRVGSYWYHDDTQAYFDDMDHYKMIKAMCKLSCSVCDELEEQANDGSKRRAKFRNIEQLKGHLFHRHRLLMCSLCLEGRKIFICEQKLYTRTQLNQHISTGDSEVDGSESERGGFTGHPMCEFCRKPYYGDNELYTHMASDHYTCHICQRQNPGQFEYYKDYDDLEIHFRQGHFLCEDEACLAKKFIVFQSESEIKRHNALEHGGNMSRSQRNAALQIPTSFRYRASTGQDRRRGRARGITFRRDSSDNSHSLGIQDSFEIPNLDTSFQDPPLSSRPHANSNDGDTSSIDPIIQPFESLATSETEPSSRYLQALGHNPRITESSFPPLSTAPGSSQQKPSNTSEIPPQKTMAARLRHKKDKNIITIQTPAPAWPTPTRGHTPPPPKPEATAPPGPTPSSYASFLAQPASSSKKPLGSTSRINHSASAPNLIGPTSNFPPVTTANPKMENIHTANKSLVEKIRAALGDEEKYNTFKCISGEYRQGSISSAEYVTYVEQFGLSHLVADLAKLCPDVQKQRELIETYYISTRFKGKGKSSNLEEEVEVEVLSKDGYRSTKGKSQVVDDQYVMKSSFQNGFKSGGEDGGGGSNKQKKKTSKLHRARLGDGSLLDLGYVDPDSDPDPVGGDNNTVRGVWRKGGGQRLLASSGEMKK